MEKLLLFDRIVRDYPGPAGYCESDFVYLNRSARPLFELIRSVLQGWLDTYDAPADKRKILVQRFRSQDDREHLAAFFELYLYQLMVHLDFKVDVEPDWPVGKPDFLLTAADGCQILLEATSTFPNRTFGSAAGREEQLIDEINRRVNSPDFFLILRIRSAPTSSPPVDRICKDINKALGKLDPDEVINNLTTTSQPEVEMKRHIISWRHENWDIEIVATPKKPEARGKTGIRPVGAFHGSVQAVDPVSSIKSRLNEKYRHYGELTVPYVLAINLHDPWVETRDISEALFGQIAFHYDLDTDDATPFRIPDGAWYETKGYQKTRMSGLLVFKRLKPTSISSRNPTLWHHPGASIPFSPALWKLDQKITNHETGRLEDVKGLSAPEVLGLDQSLFDGLYRTAEPDE